MCCVFLLFLFKHHYNPLPTPIHFHNCVYSDCFVFEPCLQVPSPFTWRLEGESDDMRVLSYPSGTHAARALIT